MSKYKSGLMQQLEEERIFEEEQAAVKKKHNIEDKNVMVVEKDNTYKFTVRVISKIIQSVAMACILLLAALGLIALIYPEPREEMFIILNRIFNETLGMIL